MRIDKFTQKGQEALIEAQNLAQKYNHPAVKTEHLLKALVEQEGGVVPSVLKRIGVDTDVLGQRIDETLDRMPHATGASVQVGMDRDLVSVLDAAEAIVDKMKDDYTSTEHILLAMVQAKAATVRELLASFGGERKEYHGCLDGDSRFAASWQSDTGGPV